MRARAAAIALRLAASWLPQGAPAKLAVLALARSHPPGDSESAPMSSTSGREPETCPTATARIDVTALAAKSSPNDAGRAGVVGTSDSGVVSAGPLEFSAARSLTTAAALAVAASQQPRGSQIARELALAAGRVHLPDCGTLLPSDSKFSAADAALAVAAGRHNSRALTASVMAAGKLQHKIVKRGRRAVVVVAATAPRFAAPAIVQPPPLPASRPVLCHDTAYHVLRQLLPPPPHPTPIGGQVVATTLRVAAPPFSSGHPPSAQATSIDGRRLPPLPPSPRTLEARLRSSAPVLLRQLQQVSAVSAAWAQHTERDAWPATHVYLYQEMGSRSDLRRRYNDSARRLLVTDWLRMGLAHRAGARPTPEAAGLDPTHALLATTLTEHIEAFTS